MVGKGQPKHLVYLQKINYCDICATLNEQICAQQTTLNHIRKCGSAKGEDQTLIESIIASLNKELKTHKDEAQGTRLEEKDDKTDEENEQLKGLKHKFTLTMSCDYQMQKLVHF